MNEVYSFPNVRIGQHARFTRPGIYPGMKKARYAEHFAGFLLSLC